MCSAPYRPPGKLGDEWRCGKCGPCLINRRREWTTRILLEQRLHSQSFFLTLTYAEENLTFIENGLATLWPADLRNFWKRLRRSGEEVRYYACGEYGDLTWRPHYHAIVFGLRSFLDVEKIWGLGHVHVDVLTAANAAYTAGYCQKSMMSEKDPRLLGRHPEFSRMSRKPGLGGDVADKLVPLLYSEFGRAYDAAHGDVFSQVRIDGKVLPLGRYLKNRLRGTDEVPPLALRVARDRRFFDERPTAGVRAHDRELARSYLSLRRKKI